jgi:dolichol-phosphate mannosyltransferase
MSLQLSVIVPTFNELENIEEIVRRLDITLRGISWEVIFVDDDSPDGTARKAKEISLNDARVRCIKRIGRRGLSSACVEGMLASSAPFLAVMDADLQHDESILPAMLNALELEKFELAVGTRYMPGGGVGDWDESRKNSSKLATVISQKLLGVSLNDPMSGFFMIKSEAFDRCAYRLSNMGFKILLDIVVSSPKRLTVKELPFHFRQRMAGESKLDQRVVWDYFLLLIDKTIGQYIPTKLISFACIGAMGVIVHLLVLGVALNIFKQPFTFAQSEAVILAMVFNFNLNNILTYSDQKLTGIGFWFGLVKFMLACSIGALANVGVASFIYKDYGYWVISGLAGVLVGVVWNYVATSLVVWPKKINK